MFTNTYLKVKEENQLFDYSDMSTTTSNTGIDKKVLNQVVQSVIKQYPTIFSSTMLDKKSEILPSLLSWKIPGAKSSYESPVKESSSSSSSSSLALAQTPPRLLQSAQNAASERKTMKSVSCQVNLPLKTVNHHHHHPEVEVKSNFDIINTNINTNIDTNNDTKIDITPMFQPYELRSDERDSINKFHKDLIVSGVKSTPIFPNASPSSMIMPSINIQKPDGVNIKTSPKKSTQKTSLILSPPRIRFDDGNDDLAIENALTIGKAHVLKK